MRGRASVFYWTATGALMGFGLIGLMSIGFPFLIVGTVMAVVGIVKPGPEGAWAFPVGFGGLPALIFLSHMVEGISTTMNPYCSKVGEGGGTIILPAGSAVDEVSCSFIPASYYVMFAIFATIALFGLMLRFLLRHRARTLNT